MASPDVISLTPHHAKYYAHDLTRRPGSGMDRFSKALFDASVDLNPHQVEVVLFALHNRLTIESGEASPTVEQGFACVFTNYVSEEFLAAMKSGHAESMDVMLYKDGGNPGDFKTRVSMFEKSFPFERYAINEHVFRMRSKSLGQPFLYLQISHESGGFA